MRCDRKDRLTFKKYLQRYSPFRFSDKNRLVRLSLGVVSAECIVTCDVADEIGFEAEKKWDKTKALSMSHFQRLTNVSDD